MAEGCENEMKLEDCDIGIILEGMKYGWKISQQVVCNNDDCYDLRKSNKPGRKYSLGRSADFKCGHIQVIWSYKQ